MPPKPTQQASTSNLSSLRTMPEDLRNAANAQNQFNPLATPPISPIEAKKTGGFFSSLLQSKKSSVSPKQVSENLSTTPIRGSSVSVPPRHASAETSSQTTVQNQGSIWDSRLPQIERNEQFINGTPPPSPIINRVTPAPVENPKGVANQASPRPVPQKPNVVIPLAKESIEISKIKSESQVKGATHPLVDDGEVGIDLGIDEILGASTKPINIASKVSSATTTHTPPTLVKGTPISLTHGAAATSSVIKSSPQPFPKLNIPSTPSPVKPQVSTLIAQKPFEEKQKIAQIDSHKNVIPPIHSVIGLSTPEIHIPLVSAVVAQPVVKVAQPLTDLDGEKIHLENERSGIATKKISTEEEKKLLVSQRDDIEKELGPIIPQEADLLRSIDELERREAVSEGEDRRKIEKERWEKVELRRSLEAQKFSIKKRLETARISLQFKDEALSAFMKREGEILERLKFIEKEKQRRLIQGNLDVVVKERLVIEGKRKIIEELIATNRKNLIELEKSEKQVESDRRTLVISTGKTIAEEEQFAQKRYDLEKKQHDAEIKRWAEEDALKKHQGELAQTDIPYAEVITKETSLKSQLSALAK